MIKDDSPHYCEHHYCSVTGSENRTEIYVVPIEDINAWNLARKDYPDEGVMLYERPEIPLYQGAKTSIFGVKIIAPHRHHKKP